MTLLLVFLTLFATTLGGHALAAGQLAAFRG
ncbi:Uncharacterised protein [Klebsiella variicola]|uniref:Uncharacterized protein n=1 Tax=Klebsiella variicola TaxID=244366 RepID=A0A7H4MR57_KLEVA|nr:Uncharacterised protein [Klebsiella variicola]